MAEAKRWVDGYVQYPLVTEPPVFSICPGCSSPFWIADAAVAGTFSFTATEGCDPGWEKLPYVPDPSYMSILKALTGGAAARKPIGHEIYLRLLGMQKFNHGRRVHVHYARACRGDALPEWEPADPVVPPDASENQNSLVTLLSADKGIEFEDSRAYFLLMYAEVCREMGRFQSALQALEEAAAISPLGLHADAVKRLSVAGKIGIYLL